MANKKRDLIKDFGRIWSEKTSREDGVIPAEELKGFTDPASVIMIIPKKVWIRDAIRNIFDLEGQDMKAVDKLDYSTHTVSALDELVGYYSPHYLALVLRLALNTDDMGAGIKIKFRPDYPLMIENEDLKIIIAPRHHSK